MLKGLFHNFLAPLLALGLALPAGAQGVSGGRLPTRWDKDVSATSPLPDYPRPQMVRKAWQSLNGPWDYALTDKDATAAPAAYAGRILVPYPYESALSRVGKASVPDQRLWYRRAFTIPSSWQGRRVLLHFGAVNWDSGVFVNGRPIGTHRGGYDGFEFDITDVLKPGANELVVSAWNPLRSDVPDAQVLGKQRLHPGGIFYTGVTGIWQSVWLEPVPAVHIAGLQITPDVDNKVLRLTVRTHEPATDPNVVNATAQLQETMPVQVTVLDGHSKVATLTGTTDTQIKIPIPSPHLWSPTDPHLYGLRVSLMQGNKTDDSVDSYFAMRKVSLGKDTQGRTRLFLNNRFALEIGALDQGYWPDGIYTAPTDDALKYDIQMAKKFGFNLLRKHAKVEPERWYYWTDRLGMLVWQDMPQAFGDLNDSTKQQWLTEWRREIETHDNHPSIIVWTMFNEDWGQHDTEQIVALTKQWDPTRLVNDASGWTDKGVGDLRDTHAYPGPWSEKPEPTRAAVAGEFGGVTMRVPGHMWEQGVFGYGLVLENGWQVTRRYQQLLKTAYGLADTQGASAFVYTQLTDVEQESNGLMTYDRAVVKPDMKIVAAANTGVFLPLPPRPPSHDLVPTSEDTPQTWSYTMARPAADTSARPAADWAQPGFDSSTWKTGPAPFGQGYDGVRTPWTDTPGDIWLRRTVTLPAVIPARLDVLALHDEDVEVYVNGVLAASATGYNGGYVRLPMSDAARAALHPGPNLIAVHCRQTIGGQVIDVGIVQTH
ncbi:MAG: glycoside hydrolase family 2 [Armatimonadetes bacterium]|nr:glycoside hydrolase family 2 [Armatimonadota bacterium]